MLADLPHRAIWAVAVPAMATAVATALVGVVDTWAIGQTNDAGQMAGVAIGAMLFSILLFSCNFLRMGTTGLTARAFGAGDTPDVLRIVLRALVFALLISGVLLLAKIWLGRAGIAALGGAGAVAEQAQAFIRIRLWSLPFAMLSMALVGHLMGVQAMRPVMKIEILYNLGNAFFCLLLVHNQQISPRSLAIANIAAELLKFLCLAGFVGSRYGWAMAQMLSDRLTWQAAAILKLGTINRDLFLRTSLLMLCLAAQTRAGANAGAIPLAANQILFQFFILSALVLDGFEAAAQTLGGGAVGARAAQTFRHLVRGCLLWGGVSAGGIVVFYALFGHGLIGSFTDNQAVENAARSLLVWAMISPLIGVWSFVYDGTFIGAGWTRAMLLTMAISAAIYLLLVWMLVPIWGMNGLWVAFLSLFVARGLAQAMLYPRLTRQTFTVSSVPNVEKIA